MRYPIIYALVLSCLFSINVRGEDLKSRIEKVPNIHPRLFFSSGDEVQLKQRINSDPLLRKAFTHVTTIADGIQEVKQVERKMTGKRLLHISRMCLKRMMYLGLAYRLTGDKSYAIRAQEEMLAAARFTDWNPSHFLDVAEMTMALAVGYDWMYKELDPEARRIIKEAIIEKGLRTSLKEGWWVSAENNWNQVCHGGLTVGALAILEDDPELAEQIIERALKNLPKAMAEYAPDGAYPEGPGYWGYGTTYNVIMISALESVFGTDFGLSTSKGFMECSDYYLHATGPTGFFFNYSDCPARGGVSPAMYWFAATRKKPSLLWRERQELQGFLSKTHSARDDSNTTFPFLILWAGELDNIPMPKTTHWKGEGKTPVALHRSGWETSEEIFLGVKAGSPGANHGQMDIGCFVLDAQGIRWALDLGLQSYHSLESKGVDLWNMRQDSQRWDVFRLNNFSHNTLVVDGQKQRVAGFAPIVAFSDQAPMPYTIVDLGSVYEGQLAAAKRGVGLHSNCFVVVQDEIETLDRKTSIRWGMVTRATVKIETERQALLQQNGQQCVLRVLSPEDAKLELFETAKPPNDYDHLNKGTRMIGFKVEIAPSTKVDLVVQLCPGDAESNPFPAIELAAW